MRVMVTGGAGYVGSVVVQQFQQAGHDVWVIDSLVQGHRRAVLDGAHLVEGDIADTALVSGLLRRHEIEAVVHMAAATVVCRSYVEPRFFFEENLIKALTLVHTMLDCKVERLVFSSTASVFGEPKFIPITEDHPYLPISAYGQSKISFESALDYYYCAYGLKSVTFRYFNAAGASDDIGEHHCPETHIIPLLLRSAASGTEPFCIYGNDYPTPDGSCIRDYVHVVDLAQAHLLALEGIDGIGVGRYNLGSGNGVSVLKLIRQAEEITGLRVPTMACERRVGDPSVLVACSERARHDLGWTPKHSEPAHILNTAWEWYRKHPEGYSD